MNEKGKKRIKEIEEQTGKPFEPSKEPKKEPAKKEKAAE